MAASTESTGSTPATDTRRWSDALHARGRRVTKQRLAVLDVVEHGPHATADDVHAAVRVKLPEITLQSVYVVLADLADIGLLRKIEPPDSPARFETRIGDNHHHAVCTGCGRIEDVDCVVGHAPCLSPSDSAGMQIEVAEVLFRGLCADCRTRARDRRAAAH